MNDEELRDYLKRFCFGREHLICSRDLVRQKNLRESDLRKKVNRLRRKAVPIASSREGYFYASNAAELYSTIRHRRKASGALRREKASRLDRAWRLLPGAAFQQSG